MIGTFAFSELPFDFLQQIIVLNQLPEPILDVKRPGGILNEYNTLVYHWTIKDLIISELNYKQSVQTKENIF